MHFSLSFCFLPFIPPRLLEKVLFQFTLFSLSSLLIKTSPPFPFYHHLQTTLYTKCHQQTRKLSPIPRPLPLDPSQTVLQETTHLDLKPLQTSAHAHAMHLRLQLHYPSNSNSISSRSSFCQHQDHFIFSGQACNRKCSAAFTPLSAIWMVPWQECSEFKKSGGDSKRSRSNDVNSTWSRNNLRRSGRRFTIQRDVEARIQFLRTYSLLPSFLS